VKLTPYLKQHAIKSQGWVEVAFRGFFTSVLDGGQWSASSPSQLTQNIMYNNGVSTGMFMCKKKAFHLLSTCLRHICSDFNGSYTRQIQGSSLLVSFLFQRILIFQLQWTLLIYIGKYINILYFLPESWHINSCQRCTNLRHQVTNVINFVWWCLISVGPQAQNVSPFRQQRFSGGFSTSGKFLDCHLMSWHFSKYKLQFFTCD
jgi:hypothetical protein